MPPTALPRFSRRARCLALALVVAAAGCAPARTTTVAFEPAADARGMLTGTAWQLVAIRSGDGTVRRPREGATYTLRLHEHGDASIRADCNRATTRWESPEASRIEFGPIASTRAKCPEGSISRRFLEQLRWVRSYVLEDGHLFLATRADGAILEFAPPAADGE